MNADGIERPMNADGIERPYEYRWYRAALMKADGIERPL